MIGRWLLLVLVVLAGCSASPISDAALVHCASHRSDTVDAAVALGLVDSTSIGNRILKDGYPLEFDEWRRTRQQEFEKACKAAAEPHMQPAAPASAPGWVTTAITVAATLLSTALGWWITWVTTNRREDRNRAREHSVELRRAGREFVDEVRDYCATQLRERASPTELRRKRDLLNTQLAVTKLMRPDWSAPDVLRTELDAFGDSVEEGWYFENDRSERQPRAAEVTAAAAKLDRRIEVVVQALRRPGDASEWLDDEFGRVVGA